MRFAFIAAKKAKHRVTILCRCMRVTRARVDVKKEKVDRFPSYSDAQMALFDYIEVFYNQRRRHSTLGQISPAAFERGAAA